MPMFTQLPRETVRKVPTGSELKPHKSTKQGDEALFRCSGGQNGGSRAYSRPFSDSVQRRLPLKLGFRRCPFAETQGDLDEKGKLSRTHLSSSQRTLLLLEIGTKATSPSLSASWVTYGLVYND